MSFKGRQLSPESIQKRTEAMLATRAGWSDEFREYVRGKLSENGKKSAAKGSGAHLPHRFGVEHPGFNSVEMACKTCGKVCLVPQHRKDTWSYCSRACHYQTSTVVCETCGVAFKRKRSAVQKGERYFCGRACRQRPLHKCERCGVEFRRSGKRENIRFCTAECRDLDRTKYTPEMKRLHYRMLHSIWLALKKNKAGESWQTLVGYTVFDLKAHLEALFQPGMSWTNMGEWHVDHIRPRSSFEFDSPTDPQFLECWALSNLQPLWKLDNLRKSSRLGFKVGQLVT